VKREHDEWADEAEAVLTVNPLGQNKKKTFSTTPQP